MDDAAEEEWAIAAFDAAIGEADQAIPWEIVKAELGWTDESDD